jgi:hypothetical protein
MTPERREATLNLLTWGLRACTARDRHDWDELERCRAEATTWRKILAATLTKETA